MINLIGVKAECGNKPLKHLQFVSEAERSSFLQEKTTLLGVRNCPIYQGGIGSVDVQTKTPCTFLLSTKLSWRVIHHEQNASRYSVWLTISALSVSCLYTPQAGDPLAPGGHVTRYCHRLINIERWLNSCCAGLLFFIIPVKRVTSGVRGLIQSTVPEQYRYQWPSTTQMHRLYLWTRFANCLLMLCVVGITGIYCFFTKPFAYKWNCL